MARAMKDSGIEWIGEIPEGWESKQLKYLVSYNDESLGEDTNPDYEFDYIDIGSVEYGKGITQYQHMRFADSPSRARRVVHDKDVILSTVRTYLKAVATIDDRDNPQIASTGFVVLRAKQGQITPDYLHYSVLSNAFVSLVEAKSTGISYPAINASEVVEIKIPVPKISEQKRIADYLDSECARIDAVIEQTRASIEEYKKLKQSVITQAVTKGIRPGRKMKDSGVEWIGEIPKDWIIRKGKWILNRLERPVEETDGVITCFRDGEVTLRSNRREEGFTISLQEAGYQGIDAGDLVVHGMDGFAGAIGISDSRGKGTPVLNVLDSTQHKRYIMYYLRSMAYNGVFLALSTGIRVRSCDTNWNKLKELPYPLPPIEEQVEIAQFIDTKLMQFDEIIKGEQQLLAELESYKKSLIFEYVTGKKEVG